MTLGNGKRRRTVQTYILKKVFWEGNGALDLSAKALLSKLSRRSKPLEIPRVVIMLKYLPGRASYRQNYVR